MWNKALGLRDSALVTCPLMRHRHHQLKRRCHVRLLCFLLTESVISWLCPSGVSYPRRHCRGSSAHEGGGGWHHGDSERGGQRSGSGRGYGGVHRWGHGQGEERCLSAARTPFGWLKGTDYRSGTELLSFHLKWAFCMIPQRCWKCPCHWFSLVLQISFKSAVYRVMQAVT